MAYKIGKWTVNEDFDVFQEYLNAQLLKKCEIIHGIAEAIASNEKEPIPKRLQALGDLAKKLKEMDETMDLSYITNDDSGRTPSEEVLFYVNKNRMRLLAKKWGIVDN